MQIAGVFVQIVVEKGSGKGSVFFLHDGINTLGRHISNRIRLLDPRVSRHHCKIRKIGQSLFLSDLGTRNGTTINGEYVIDCEIEIGDRIVIGATVLKVINEEYEPEPTFKQPAPFSFFRVISMAFSGKRSGRGAEADYKDSYRFFPRGRKALWRPTVDSDPPEGSKKTVISTDPD